MSKTPGTGARVLASESIRLMLERPHPMTEGQSNADLWARGFEAGLDPVLQSTRNTHEAWREGFILGRQCSELCAHRDRFALTLEHCNGPADLSPQYVRSGKVDE